RSLDLYGPGLRFWERLRLPMEPEELNTALLLPAALPTATDGGPVLAASKSFPEVDPPPHALLMFARNTVWAQAPAWSGRHRASLGWTPGAWGGDGETPAPLSWRMPDTHPRDLAGG